MSTKDMMTVKIEGDAIVIRVPMSVLAFASVVAFEEAFGEGGRNRVTDPAVFSAAVLEELDYEAEDGATLVTKMLDEAMVAAVENGCEGVEEE